VVAFLFHIQKVRGSILWLQTAYLTWFSFILSVPLDNHSGGSSVDIVNRLRAGWSRNPSTIPVRVRDFSLLSNIYTGFEAHPAPPPHNGYRQLFSLGTKLSGCEADH
jgi:hypothetical protein